LDLLQFGLIIVTIVLLAVVIYQRLARMESYLRDLHGIQTLNTRLKGLVDAFEQLGTKRLEEQLGEIADLLERNLAAQNQRPEVQVVPQVIEAVAPSGNSSAMWSRPSSTRSATSA
jgi:2',3'-cyclic-nucleotide 2'-phosphodiesterase (5'-nucleotidase family)